MEDDTKSSPSKDVKILRFPLLGLFSSFQGKKEQIHKMFFQEE